MKSISLIILIVFTTSFSFSQGLMKDSVKYKSLNKLEMDDFGFTGTLPSSVSMRKYCPTPGLQQGQSCVGWASSYAAMSIMHNKSFGITNAVQKTMFAFDAYFVYSLIAETYDYDCSEGTFIFHAMDVLKTKGSKRMFAPELTSCNSLINATSKGYALPFTIEDYYTPPESYLNGSFSEKISILKAILADSYPVIIGMNTTASIGPSGAPGGKVSSSGLWDPSAEESFDGSHAMCVVGYSNTKHGGAFEIMNSWGSNYGDDGFIWIKYNDFIRLVDEIYIIEPSGANSGSCLLGDCSNSYSHVKWDGSRYEGECLNGKRSGFGIMYFESGWAYAGYWSNGMENGFGILYSPEDQRFYSAKFSNGELLEAEALGFGEGKETEEEKQMKAMFDSYQKGGIISIGSQEEFEKLDIDLTHSKEMK